MTSNFGGIYWALCARHLLNNVPAQHNTHPHVGPTRNLTTGFPGQNEGLRPPQHWGNTRPQPSPAALTFCFLSVHFCCWHNAGCYRTVRGNWKSPLEHLKHYFKMGKKGKKQAKKDLAGKGVWGRMDTRICMAESLCCSPETITALLISYTPIENKKLQNK